jgi:hypothetical protein
MKQFTFLLHCRRETIRGLAKKAGVGRAHLHRVIRGDPIGAYTRPKVAPLLSKSELQALGWNKDGTFVPCGTPPSIATARTLVDGWVSCVRGRWNQIRWVTLVKLLQCGWDWCDGGLYDRRGKLIEWKLVAGRFWIRRSE